MKLKLLVAATSAMVLAQSALAYDIIINNANVYSDTQAINKISVEQNGSQLILKTDPPVQIQIGGGSNGGNNATTPVAPVFTSSPTLTVAENQTSVGLLTATDGNGDNVTFSITGGVDRHQFRLSGTNNATLSFVSPKDYENPDDVGTDRTYDIDITATDNSASALSTVQNLSVTLSDVNENTNSGNGNCPAQLPNGTRIDYPIDLSGNPNGQIVMSMGNETISMPFTVPANAGNNYWKQYIFSSTVGTAGVTRQMWISECPSTDYDDYLGAKCRIYNNTNGRLKIMNNGLYTRYGYCEVQNGKTYYLNIKNIGCQGSRCPTYREIH